MPLTSNRLQRLVKHPQFVWWISHCCVILCVSIYFLYWITFSSSKVQSLYYWAYRGAILSFSLVSYKTHGVPSLNWNYFRRIHDENVYYLLLASVWYFNPPIFVTLIPYVTFSLFHFLTYIRSNLIPTFIPAASPGAINTGFEGSGNVKKFVDISKGIYILVQGNYETAMRAVSRVEVVVITSFLFFHTLTLYINVFTLLVYLTFLRFRYHMNFHTRSVFFEVSKRLDNVFLPPTADPRIPPFVTRVYRHAKTLVRYAGRLPQSQTETSTKDL